MQEMCESSDDEAKDAMDWNNLGFGLMETDYMYVMKIGNDDEFQQGKLCRYGNIELSPSAGVLNYGQVHTYVSLPFHLLFYYIN